jgi:hypothetical protein
MGAGYSSRIFIHRSDLGQPFDYSDRQFTAWRDKGVQGPRIEQAKKADIGLVAAYGQDLNYFAAGFGNAVNSVVDVSLNRTGEFFSRAFNTQKSIDGFIANNYVPTIVHADLQGLYHELRDFAAKKGLKDSFDIKGFGSDNSDAEAGASVDMLTNGDAIFYKNTQISKWTKTLAAQYGVSEKAVSLYLMMHEFMHLSGIKGEGAAGEAKLEKLLEEFATNKEKQLNSAYTHNEARKLELSSLMAEIKRIAKIRYGVVEELYGHREDLSARVKGNYTQNQLESMVSKYTREAVARGINTEAGVKKYVAMKITEKAKADYKKEKAKKKKSKKKAKKAKK